MGENALAFRVDRLEAALVRLVEAQAATQGEIRALVEAQRRTEERLDALVVRVDQLAEAQVRTEHALAQLTARVDDLTQRMERVEDQIARLTARVDDLTVRLEQLTRRVDELAVRLQQLTARVEQLTARVDDLTQRMERVEDQIARLTERIERVEEQIAQLTQRMERVEDQIARLTDRTSSLTGIMLELRYRERAHVYFNRVLRRVRLLSPDALDRLLDEAEAAGRLTRAESEDLRLADILARGMRREDGAEAYLAAEISGLVELDDVAHAARRAELLARATGRPAVAVVAGERIPPDIDRIACQSGVWRVLDGAALPPSVDVPSPS